MKKYFMLLLIAAAMLTGCSIAPKLTIGREGDVNVYNGPVYNIGSKTDTVTVEKTVTDTLHEVIRVDPFGPVSSKDGLYGERISRPQTISSSSSWKELEFESSWLFGVSADFKFGQSEKGFSLEAGKSWLWKNNIVELGTSAAVSYSYIGNTLSVTGLGRAGFGSSWKGYISVGGSIGAKNFDTMVAHPVVEIGASHSEGLEIFVRGSFIETITSVGIRFVM